MNVQESQLISWSRPVSTTEDEKCKNAISQINEVLKKRFGSSVRVFLQGSYQNNTNVRKDSDVDIVACYEDVFYHDISFLNEQQKAIYEANRNPATYNFSTYKNDVQKALTENFGSDVLRKNKCIKVTGNTYRVNADVVPCMQLRRFGTPTEVSAKGIEFFSDAGEVITSFPEQHYQNGTQKTNNTGRMYKRTVRIIKNVRNILVDQGSVNKDAMSSFFIECLVWNVPNGKFVPGYYEQTLKNVILQIYGDMSNEARYNEYAEVSDLKWLFRGGNRSPEMAKAFFDKVWDYIGLTN